MSVKNIVKLGIVFMLTTGVVHAQEVKLDTVTVTANKMEENIQDVPQSITVLNAEVIKEKGIKNIGDIIKEIPNMRYEYGDGALVNFRGLNQSIFSNNNPVVIYIDGIATSSRQGFDASLVNVDRVEVLRGPQGTLFGKDAIGAVINIVTKEPSNKTTGFAGAEYGNYNYMRGFFNISTPLIDDKLFFGLNGEANKDDGWITNDYNGDKKAGKESDYSFSTFLKYNINDRLSTKIILNKEQTEDYWSNALALGVGGEIGSIKREDVEHVNFDIPMSIKSDTTSQSFSMKYRADSFTIDSITTHKEIDYDGTYDADFGNNPFFDGLKFMYNFEEDIYTQEFRVSSNNKEGFRWVAGVYLDKESREFGPFGNEFPFFNPAPPYNFLGNYSLNALSKIDSKTQALFGQTMIPFRERFELTLGGRLQKITKEIDLKTYFLPIGTTGPAMYTMKDKKSWNSFLPKIALSYEINENYTTYASVSKGYMPGGHNNYAMTGTVEDNTFEPQKSVSYELGLKGVISNLSFSAAIFRMDITDIHVFKSPSPGIYLTDNAEKAHSQGIEFDFNYFPTDYLEISGALGFIDAKYDDYDTGSVNYDGQKIERTPSHTINLGVAYRHPSGYYGRVDVANMGDVYFHDDVSARFVKGGGYTTADIKAGYKFSDFDVYAYVKNITDEEYVKTFSPTVINIVATVNDPRTFGIGFKYKF